MFKEIVFVVGLTSSCVVVIGSILVTGGAEK